MVVGFVETDDAESGVAHRYGSTVASSAASARVSQVEYGQELETSTHVGTLAKADSSNAVRQVSTSLMPVGCGGRPLLGIGIETLAATSGSKSSGMMRAKACVQYGTDDYDTCKDFSLGERGGCWVFEAGCCFRAPPAMQL